MKSYTKLPNVIIDAMSDMSKAELKVTIAIVRNTFGFHRQTCKLTFSDLEEITGMSRGGVSSGVKAVEKRGFFNHDGSDWSVYLLDQNSLITRPDAVYSLDQGGLVIRPESVYSLDQNTPVLKKGNKTTKESGDGDVAIGEVYDCYHNNIGELSKIMSDDIEDWFNDVGGQWLLDAMVIAVKANKKSWAYVEGILKRWKRDGRQDRQIHQNGKVKADDATGGYYV